MTVWTKLGLAIISGVTATFLSMPIARAVTYPGRNGSLAFSQTRQGIANIWLVQENRTPPRQLTYFGAKSPVWSPDGRKMAVVTPWNQLQILDKNGRLMTWLPYAAGYTDGAPVWSPDGTRLAFVRTQLGSERSAVLSVAIHSKHLTNISGWLNKGGYRAPSWSPDGSHMAYEQFGMGRRVLFIKNIASGELTWLTTLSDDISSGLDWSPNGKKILFNDSTNQVYTIWPDGSHRTVISDGDSRNAVWSPNGNQLAFIEDKGINISEPDGTVVRVYDVPKGRLMHLSWSPDGSRIAFITTHNDSSSMYVLTITNHTVERILSTPARVDVLSWQAM